MEFSSVDPVLSDEEEYEDFFSVQEEEDGSILEKGVDMRELLGGCIFQTRMTGDAAEEELDQTYRPEDVLEQIQLQCKEDEDGVFISEVTSFDKIAEKMFNLTADGKIKKKVLKEGWGEVVPPNAVVWFHHNSYYEMCESPFDSSYLRGVPVQRRLGVNQCVPGLEIGLQSMKVGEKAWFLVHYDYAYKKMGVPPRIPPESAILFQVEMKKFLDNASALKIGEAEEEDLQKMEFTQVYRAVLALVEDANLLVKQKRNEPAVKLYRRALRCLEKANKNSDEEEQRFVNMEVKINTNLAVILNKLGQSQRAIVAARNALYYKSDNAKAYYQLASAHLALGSHSKATEAALTAKKYEPRNADVLGLLIKIQKTQQKYEENTVVFAKNMLGFSNKNSNKCENAGRDEVKVKCLSNEVDQKEGEKKTPQKAAVKAAENGMSSGEIVNCSERFKLLVIDYVKEFVDDVDAEEAPLASSLTYDEEQFVREQARNYKIMIRGKEVNGTQSLFLSKR